MRHSKRGIVLGVFLCLLVAAGLLRGDEDAAKENAADKKKRAAAAAAAAERKAAVKIKVQAVEALNADVIMLDNGVVMQRKQAREQVAQLFKVELAYVRRVCELTPQQTEVLGAAAVGAIDDVMKRFGRNNNRPRRGNVFGNGQAALTGDVRLLVMAKVNKIVSEHLQPEQVKRHTEEMNKRDEHFRRSTAQFFVARIDEKLCLTAAQRQELFQTLSDDWRDQYGMTVEVLLQHHQYVPQVSSRPLMAILDDYQKEIWRTLPKVGPQRHGAFGVGGNAELVDDFQLPGEEPAAEPQAQEGQAEAFAR